MQFQFAKIVSYNAGMQPFFASFVDTPPVGTCYVYNNPDGANNAPIANLVNADAGASFTVNGPNGSVSVAGSPGKFQATLSAAGTFLTPGGYTVTGNGGADIGPINAAITIPAPPTFAGPRSRPVPA